jgi:phage gp36-like protein
MASSYAQVSDLLKYGLSQAALNTVTTDVTIQQAHLDAASDLADSYLRSKFNLPLISWGLALTQKVCEIGAYTLIDLRGYDPENPLDMPIYNRYKAAVSWLERITEGEVNPVVVDSSGDPALLGVPNTLQMNTSGSTTQASPGGTINIQVTPDGGTTYTGAPRQRGWR